MFFEQNVDFQYFSEKELIKQTCSEINWTLPYIYIWGLKNWTKFYKNLDNGYPKLFMDLHPISSKITKVAKNCLSSNSRQGEKVIIYISSISYLTKSYYLGI